MLGDHGSTAAATLSAVPQPPVDTIDTTRLGKAVEAWRAAQSRYEPLQAAERASFEELNLRRAELGRLLTEARKAFPPSGPLAGGWKKLLDGYGLARQRAHELIRYAEKIDGTEPDEPNTPDESPDESNTPDESTELTTATAVRPETGRTSKPDIRQRWSNVIRPSDEPNTPDESTESDKRNDVPAVRCQHCNPPTPNLVMRLGGATIRVTVSECTDEERSEVIARFRPIVEGP